MELRYSELESGIACIELLGTMDTQGVGAIEIKFAGYSSGDHARVLVDLSNVDFMASISIRLLITTARAVATRGGKLVLLNPNENVMDVLDVTGVPDIIPVYKEKNAAIAALN